MFILNPFIFGPGGNQYEVLLAEDGGALLPEDAQVGDWFVLEDGD